MNTNEISIRIMKAEDWQRVAEIYKEGINTGNATFQQDVPTWAEWDDAHLKSCRFIAEIDHQIAGWAALTPVSGTCVYAGVAEVSVYISNKYKGQKVGTKLLERLITASEDLKLWTLQAGIFPENTASLKIHENLGFRQVGFREKIGKMNGIWRNTVLLEKRSMVSGVN